MRATQVTFNRSHRTHSDRRAFFNITLAATGWPAFAGHDSSSRIVSLVLRPSQQYTGIMRWESLDREHCSLARALAVIGDRWTLLVLREAFMGVRRFDDFEKSLKIARRVLSERLALLVDEGVLRKVPYQERPHALRISPDGERPRALPRHHLAGALGRPLLCGRRGPADRCTRTRLRARFPFGRHVFGVRRTAGCARGDAASQPGSLKSAVRSRSRTAARR